MYAECVSALYKMWNTETYRVELMTLEFYDYGIY